MTVKVLAVLEVLPVPVVVVPSDLYQVKPIVALMTVEAVAKSSVISGTKTNSRLRDPGTEI